RQPAIVISLQERDQHREFVEEHAARGDGDGRTRIGGSAQGLEHRRSVSIASSASFLIRAPCARTLDRSNARLAKLMLSVRFSSCGAASVQPQVLACRWASIAAKRAAFAERLNSR